MPIAHPSRPIGARPVRAAAVAALALFAGGAAAAPPSTSPPAAPTSLETGTRPPTAPAILPVVHPTQTGPDARRWTDETPDAMVEDARARALAANATEADVLAARITLGALAERASWPAARTALEAVARSAAKLGNGPGARPGGADLAGEAALAARTLAEDEGTDQGTAADAKLGVLTNVALLGPFRDTGGGLAAKEGPEATGGSFADVHARYAWGTVDVGWRAVPPHFAGAQGVPLEVFVHPRKDGCSIVASEITLPAAGPIVVRIAATGSVRLMFDGAELGRSDDVHDSAKVDRLASLVDAPAGEHLIAAKVCEGALEDEGRVRLRLTDKSGAPIEVTSSATLRDPRAKTRVVAHRMTTPLERVLTATSGPLDAMLDAIVARTLGGADDLKSPRAPGLLDAITRRKDLDPDRLGMAGWVAPSGANRSGWLNLARSRAQAAGDLRTSVFAERRLVAEHLTARLPDWAMAAKGGAKVDSGDAEGLLLSAMIEQALGTDALRLHAMHSLAQAADAAPNTVPNAMLNELAELASSYDPNRRLFARKLLAARGENGLTFVTALASQGAQAVGEAAKKALDDAAVDDAEEAISIAQTAARSGAHDVARALFAKLTTWAPNLPDAWAGLADEMTLEPSPQADGAVAAALRRARELAPGEARYREQLALRQTSEPSTEWHDDERYLVAPQAILARRQGVPAHGAPDVADRELYWLRAVVMHPDRRVSQLIHYAREIVIPPRTQEELIEDIPPEGDLFEILRARVYRKSGGTTFPTEEHNEGTRPRIRWPELEPGDTVEVAVRTWTAGAVGGRGDSPFSFLDYAGATSTHPLLYNEVVVDAPATNPIYLDILHGVPDRREDKDDNGRHVTRLIWDRPPLVSDEPLAPALSEIVPMTIGSSFKSWADFRVWYTGAIRDFAVPDDQIKRLAQELTRGKTTRDDKLRKIFDFVADDIRYVNYTSGEWWLPNRPQQLLARREGDCDDKAILLISLLKVIGIDAQEVMVQTRDTGQPSILLSKNAAVPLFDHGIAFLPGVNLFGSGGGGTYLDATSPQSRLGPLPSMDARAVALRIDRGPAEIVELPASLPEAHGSDVLWTLTLHADGSGDLAGEETHAGDGAFWLRTSMTEEGSARASYVQNNLVSGWFPTVDVDPKVDFKGDLSDGRAWVRYRAHSDGLARHEQGELVVPLAPSATLASQLAPLVERTLPVSLPSHLAPSHQGRTTRILAPAGFRWGALPPGGDESDGEFGRAHLEVAADPRDPRAVVVKRTLVFDQHRIPVAKYAAWRGWLLRVDALMHRSVRLLPEGAAK
jgi:hypothetical protein